VYSSLFPFSVYVQESEMTMGEINFHIQRLQALDNEMRSRPFPSHDVQDMRNDEYLASFFANLGDADQFAADFDTFCSTIVGTASYLLGGRLDAIPQRQQAWIKQGDFFTHFPKYRFLAHHWTRFEGFAQEYRTALEMLDIELHMLAEHTQEGGSQQQGDEESVQMSDHIGTDRKQDILSSDSVDNSKNTTVEWKRLKIDHIVKIERIVTVFQIWSTEKFPYAKVKIKILEDADGSYLGVPNMAAKNRRDGSPDWISGCGRSIVAALKKPCYKEYPGWSKPAYCEELRE
jgi:hypothetical protein